MRFHHTLALSLASVAFLLQPGSAPAAATPQFSGLIPLTPNTTFPPPLPPPPQYSTYATMTPDGPVPGTSVPLPLALSDIAVDPNGSGYYGVLYQSVVHIDPISLQATPMTVAGPGITDSSWPIGITFDTSRNRVILATLVGYGYLMSYTPGASEWSLLSDLNQVDLQSILYRPSDDTIYGLPAQGLIDSLYKYDASGQFLGQLPLPFALPAGPVGPDTGYQLLLTSDDQIAILAPYLTDFSDPTHPAPPHLYLVDPDTGSVTYNATLPVPEPSSLVSLSALALLSLRRRRLSRPS